MNNELFYTDLGKAIFMAENHEIKFMTDKGSLYHATAMIIARHGKGKRHYVHPDCYGTLKPLGGDFGTDITGRLYVYSDQSDKEGWYSIVDWTAPPSNQGDNPIDIIQRSGKALFPAETEVKNDE